MKKLTQKEIVLETVEYYRTHKRALSTYGECKYLTVEGDICNLFRQQNNNRPKRVSKPVPY